MDWTPAAVDEKLCRVKERSVWVRMVLVLFVAAGALAFSVQTACSGSGSSTGVTYGDYDDYGR
ncbi:MAG: hypothetical protein JWP97_4317 [Labilithrix sp.]|nr:hypothetical protein [Labilithrix sp.]